MPEIDTSNPKIKTLKGMHLWHAPMSSCSQRVRIALAETDQSYESHIVHLERDEHASPDYQAIHPKGLVPAFVEDGKLFIESVDIIQHVAQGNASLAMPDDNQLLRLGDEAQQDLKLLTFEFLFRSGPPPSREAVASFQDNHQNDWLKQFRRDFAEGFSHERIDEAVRRTDEKFQILDEILSDGRAYLAGDSFSLADVTWMPNVHRFNLMGWPFERTPHLARWFERVAQRPSYMEALLSWQPEEAANAFARYTQQRRAEGTDIRSFGDLSD